MNKRILSALLTLAMVLSLTATVFATEGKDWGGEIDVVTAAVVNGTGYETVQEAVNAANGGVVQLLTDSEEEITVKGDLYLDLNGYSLKKVTVTGTLYGMDSATDGYVASGAVIETVEGEYAAHFRHADARRYMAIAEGEGVSFHRFYMGITKVSLVPSVTGFGYKAQFCGDAAVQAQIASVGYNLWLKEDRVVTKTTSFKDTVTLRLNHFMVDEYGQTDVNANVFVTLQDGTVITSLEYAYSLRWLVEQVDNVFASLTAAQKLAVKTMCESYNTILGWDISNILAWTE